MSHDAPFGGSTPLPQTPEVIANRLAAIVESSDDAIISKTLEGIIVTWNGGAERMFGYTADEIIGQSILVLIPPDRRDEEPEILRRIGQGERIDHYETVRLRKDGKPVDVSISISPIRAHDGTVVGISKIARDVTARIATERALREETQTLELLNETGTLIASQVGLDQVVQAVCGTATRIVGAKFGSFYAATGPRGESFVLRAFAGVPREALVASYALPGSRRGVIRCEDASVDPRLAGTGVLGGLSARDEVRSYLSVPVASRSGEIIGELVFGHAAPGCFTERHERILVGMSVQAALAIDNARLFEAERRAREHAERASLTKDQFLSTLSHELRTPLNAILGWAQLLKTTEVGRAHADPLAVIERNAQAQAQLIDDLLDMSRIEAGKLRLSIEEVDVAQLVASAIETMTPSANAKGVRLSQVSGDARALVRGDPARLRQCVWNLLSNALKFTPRGGHVRTVVHVVNSHLQISVTDDGRGIEAAFLPHVFERFRQEDASSTRREGGLGLGLAIVKHLVELHGGTIRAESQGLGHGATFVIDLPIAALTSQSSESLPPAAPGGVDAAAAPLLAGLQILVVEDERDSRELIRAMLARFGADVTSAANVDDALSLLETRRFDVIVSDISMPGRDGNELVRELRRKPAELGGRTPAIALTAFARAEDRTRSLRAGFHSHLAKPVDVDELVALIASLSQR